VNSGSKRLGFRLAKEEDRERLFAWRNLPESIAASKDGKKVLRFHHDDWFSKLLKEQPSRKLWIAELQGGEVAVGWTSRTRGEAIRAFLAHRFAV